MSSRTNSLVCNKVVNTLENLMLTLCLRIKLTILSQASQYHLSAIMVEFGNRLEICNSNVKASLSNIALST